MECYKICWQTNRYFTHGFGHCYCSITWTLIASCWSLMLKYKLILGFLFNSRHITMSPRYVSAVEKISLFAVCFIVYREEFVAVAGWSSFASMSKAVDSDIGNLSSMMPLMASTRQKTSSEFHSTAPDTSALPTVSVEIWIHDDYTTHVVTSNYSSLWWSGEVKGIGDVVRGWSRVEFS